MKFLLDENLLPSFCDILRELGYSASHVYDVDLGHTPDEEIVEFARLSGDVILTNDLDFSRIIALSGLERPSVITFRLGALNHNLFREIVLLNFADLEEVVLEGCLVTIDEGGIRIRSLPIY